MVCVDEVSQVLHQEVRTPLPPRPGQPGRQDYEYRRMGTAHLFMITAPFGGWRHVEVTARRTKLACAQILKDLVDVHFPRAPRITLVCDNLNPHKPAVLYARFEAATSRRIARRLEWVHTPKHASWLNIAAPTGGSRKSMPSNARPWPCGSRTRRRCTRKLPPGRNNAISWVPP